MMNQLSQQHFGLMSLMSVSSHVRLISAALTSHNVTDGGVFSLFSLTHSFDCMEDLQQQCSTCPVLCINLMRILEILEPGLLIFGAMT